MKILITALCLALASAPAAYAQQKSQDTGKSADTARKAPSEKQAAQRERMKECNDQAAGKKGDERKKFMSSCLSEDSASGKKPTAQQQRMKDCNRQASDKSMKGDERKKFMSSCLKGG